MTFIIVIYQCLAGTPTNVFVYGLPTPLPAGVDRTLRCRYSLLSDVRLALLPAIIPTSLTVAFFYIIFRHCSFFDIGLAFAFSDHANITDRYIFRRLFVITVSNIRLVLLPAIIPTSPTVAFFYITFRHCCFPIPGWLCYQQSYHGH